MQLKTFASTVLWSALIAGRTASADYAYVALGDSVTFGETDLTYVRSNGDRGYVGLYADALAAGNGGSGRP